MSRTSQDTPVHTRRQYLRWVSSGGLVGLAGCSGGDAGQTPATVETPTATESPTATPVPTKSPSPTVKPAEESCAATEPSLPTVAEEWWPSFRYAASNDGHNKATLGPTDQVGVAWRFDTGSRVRSSPAVFDKLVFIGSDDGGIYALDMVTGDQQWNFETGGPVRSSPAVYEGTVFVGSHDGSVYALDAMTGEKRWQFETRGKVRSSANYVNPDWVDHSLVIIGSDDGTMYLVRAGSGNKQHEVGTNGAIVASPYIALYSAPSPDGYWAGAVNLDSKRFGTYVTKRTEPDAGASADEYEPPFTFDYPAPMHSSIAARPDFYTSDTIYFGGDDGILRKFTNVIEPWTPFETNGKIRSSPAVTEDPFRVYFGSWDGGVYAVNDPGGEQQWRFETGGKVESSPAVADGTVYVGSGDHHVYALDAESGEKVWDYRTGGAVHSSPAVVAGTVFVGSDDGSVYALTACQ